MSTNTKTTTPAESEEDRQHLQGIKDDDGGGSRSMTGLVDCQRQQSVDFPCYPVANSNNFLSLSILCLILILFSSYSFFFVRCKKYYQYCNHAENVFSPSVH